MKHFINLKDIRTVDLKKILKDAKRRKSKRKKKTNADTAPIITLLVTAAKMIDNETSIADSGAYKISTMFPCIFEIIKELVECEKL